MALLDDMATLLVNAGVGVVGVSIFSSSSAIIPTGAGPYLTLIENSGVSPTRKQNQAAAATRRPMVQILVRASTYSAALAMAQAAYLALDGKFNITISGTQYVKITARQDPGDMGLDGAKRAMSGFNLDVEKAA